MPDGLFEGEIFTGAKAAEAGLVDGIGHLRTVLRNRFGEKVKLRVFGVERNWLRRRLGLAEAPVLIAERLVEAVETRAAWSRYGL